MQGVAAELFGALVDNYHDWIRTHYDPRERCMFQACHADGQENSAGLDGCRCEACLLTNGSDPAYGALRTAYLKLTLQHR